MQLGFLIGSALRTFKPRSDPHVSCIATTRPSPSVSNCVAGVGSPFHHLKHRLMSLLSICAGRVSQTFEIDRLLRRSKGLLSLEEGCSGGISSPFSLSLHPRLFFLFRLYIQQAPPFPLRPLLQDTNPLSMRSFASFAAAATTASLVFTSSSVQACGDHNFERRARNVVRATTETDEASAATLSYDQECGESSSHLGRARPRSERRVGRARASKKGPLLF